MKPSNESKGGLRGSVSSGIKRLWRSIPAARPKGDAPPPADEEAPAARAGAPTPRAEPENAKGDEWFREEKLEDAKVAYGAALEHLSRVGNLSAGDVEDEAKRTLRGVLLANRPRRLPGARAAAAGETAAARAAYERVVRDCGEAVACSPRPYARAPPAVGGAARAGRLRWRRTTRRRGARPPRGFRRADDGAGSRCRHRAVIAAKTDLALGRNALGLRPAAGDAAALDRLAKRAALLAAALTRRRRPRLAELADALEACGAPRAATRRRASSWARDASAVREEATEVDSLRERDAARRWRCAAERPPPPPPHQPGPPPMPPPPNFEAAMPPPPPPKARPPPAPRDPAAARSGSVSGASRADPVDDRKRAVRAALLRWHPDKFDLSKFHPDDRDAVSDAVAEVTRRIVKEKKFLA
ncbi:alpha-1,3-glucosidase [Aureococcus anophagefferens]|nr:alpha-1,3-glucosidase [Aureococcus anophagefferens]